MRACLLHTIVIASGIIPAVHAEPSIYRKFRVEEEQGKVRECIPIPDGKIPRWAEYVGQAAPERKKDRRVPYFEGPVTYVRPPAADGEPFFSHNHQPSLAWLPNGDLLAIWYSTNDEQGTELTVLASRFRSGATGWDASSEFFKAEKRNMHGSSIFHDGGGTIFHFNGMGPEGGKGWEKLAQPLSTDRERANSTAVPGRGLSPQALEMRSPPGARSICFPVPCTTGSTWRGSGSRRREPGDTQRSFRARRIQAILPV